MKKKTSKKKLSESFLQESSHQKRKKSSYQLDELEIPDQNINDFKDFIEPSSEMKAKLQSNAIINVHKKDGSIETKKIGRPKKQSDEKENIVSIRLSNNLIASLKKEAGEIGWQTFLKKIITDYMKNNSADFFK